MARNFSLNPQAAREANSGGKRIQDTGKYKGKIVAAFYECNQNGTESVSFQFESDGGQEAGPLTIYTHKSSGEELTGFNLVNAILTCAKVKTITAKAGNVGLYDYDLKEVVTKQKDVYPELAGRRIGFVLQLEQYTKSTGDLGHRLLIVAPFDVDTELMAAEILDRKTEPQLLGRFMEWIAKNPVKIQRDRSPAKAYAAAQSFQAPIDNDFIDSDIPF